MNREREQLAALQKEIEHARDGFLDGQPYIISYSYIAQRIKEILAATPVEPRMTGSIWPKCPWCSTELERFGGGAGRCPTCGACIFEPTTDPFTRAELDNALLAQPAPPRKLVTDEEYRKMFHYEQPAPPGEPRPGSAAAADDLVIWLDDNLANEEDAPFARRAELIEDALIEAARRAQPPVPVSQARETVWEFLAKSDYKEQDEVAIDLEKLLTATEQRAREKALEDAARDFDRLRMPVMAGTIRAYAAGLYSETLANPSGATQGGTEK